MIKNFKVFVLFLIIALSNLSASKAFAQYRIGDYYVNGDIKGIIFFVNEDEGTIAILKTEMESRYETFCIGDYINWSEKEFIFQNANRNYPYNVWDIPDSRIARLIHQNHRILCEKSKSLGYRILPRDAFLNGRVGYDGSQRLIPVFCPRFPDDDIFFHKSEALLRTEQTGILLYGIVDYISGTMKKLN